jgi:hypothetical protein
MAQQVRQILEVAAAEQAIGSLAELAEVES